MMSVIMMNVILMSVIMMSVIMMSVIMRSVIMMSVIMMTVIKSVIMLSVIMLSVILLSGIMPSVIMSSVIMLSVIVLNVAALCLLLPQKGEREKLQGNLSEGEGSVPLTSWLRYLGTNVIKNTEVIYCHLRLTYQSYFYNIEFALKWQYITGKLQ
jgi:hypothetical protein